MWAGIFFLWMAATVQLSRSQTVNIVGSAGIQMVQESAGSVEVCVVLSNAATGNSAVVTAVHTPIINTIVGQDFEAVNQELTVTTAAPSCFDVTILDNQIEDGNLQRLFGIQITLKSENTGGAITASSEQLRIQIIDTNILKIGFSSSVFTVTEGDGTVQVCAGIVNGSIASGVSITFESIFMSVPDISIQGTTSYSLSSFANSSCVTLAVTDDMLIENTEFFPISLAQGSSGIVVEFVNNAANIEIIDNDGAMIAGVPEFTRSVVEGNSSLITPQNLCVTLTNVKGGLQRDIVLNVTNVDESATIGSDYEFKPTQLIIPSGSTAPTEFCVVVNITGDEVRESDDSFRIVFRVITSDILEPTSPLSFNITILNDGDTNQCRILPTPTNGAVTQNGSDINSRANYTCMERFRLIPEESADRICGVNDWDGEDPICAAVCEDLIVDNGSVAYTNQPSNEYFGEGTLATYSCIKNYKLDGMEQRTCLNTGLWSNLDPLCKAIDCGQLENIDNGGVMHPEGTKVGATAEYNCNKFYNLVDVGDPKGKNRKCDQNGEWSGSQPTCKESGASRIVSSQVVVLIAMATLLRNHFYQC